jgi:HepT-like protein
MQTDFSELRPPVLSAEAVRMLDEFLRFRHVVRNIYAFQFDPERITRLVNQMRPALALTQTDLLAFISFLEQVAREE